MVEAIGVSSTWGCKRWNFWYRRVRWSEAEAWGSLYRWGNSEPRGRGGLMVVVGGGGLLRRFQSWNRGIGGGATSSWWGTWRGQPDALVQLQPGVRERSTATIGAVARTGAAAAAWTEEGDDGKAGLISGRKVGVGQCAGKLGRWKIDENWLELDWAANGK
jgi:hypothetical protein